jgi:WD40 repeat protein
MSHRRHRLAIMFLSLLLLPSVGAAQQNCPLPPAVQPVSKDADIFSDQQEVDLGDAMAASFAQQVKIVRDDTLNEYLRNLGDRLVKHLPPTELKFRFYLMELPEVNAFSMVGGRVYVSRKMVALARTDDELAGVLAHELGHIVTHQSAIEMTARFREVLGIKQVGDRSDIFEKFHLLVENQSRKPGHRGGEEEKHQYVADQVALYAMARAGYAPHAYVDLWDRFQQIHGKTGSWVSDLFGNTKPSERRLREMLKNVAALPAGCAEIPAGARTAEFAQWQRDVVSYSGAASEESLPGLVLKQTLARPLRPDISNLRFSPDGKYLLAQDEGGIHILTRDPLAVLFYIPVPDAASAVFTPDSQSLVFHNRSLRVESWSIAGQRRNWVHEITVLHLCLQSELSPDGTVLACLNSQFELSLIDVVSETTLVTKKSFVSPGFFGMCLASMSLAEDSDLHFIEMAFSPDARYFLAGTGAAHFAWDVTGKHELSLPGSIKDLEKSSFAFLGPDRIIGVNPSSPAKSPILRFPSGERLEQVHLANGIRFRPATHGDYLFVGLKKMGNLGLYDVKSGTMPITFKRSAADFYDGTFVSEQLSGQLSLHALGKTEAIAKIKLPEARLGPLQAVAVSPDLSWLLLSNRSRGGVWDIIHNIQTLEVRGFRGAWFGPDSVAYVDFPKFGETGREIVRVDPALGNIASGYKLTDEVATQHGPYLLVTKSRGRQNNGQITLAPDLVCLEILLGGYFKFGSATPSDVDVELHDVRDGRLLWSRYFPHEMPALTMGEGSLLLRWPVGAIASRDELAQFPSLKNVADKADYFLEQIDLQNTPHAELIIKTNKGAFTVNSTFGAGDWVIASASHNEILTYSAATGEGRGHFFGTSPSASRTGLLAINGEVGEVNLYDMATSQLRQQYSFSDPVSFKTFSPDGNRLFVITASQTAYILDVTATN